MYWFPFNISFITFIINCIPFLYRKSALYISFVWSFFLFLYFESECVFHISLLRIWLSASYSFISNLEYLFNVPLLRIPVFVSRSFTSNPVVCFIFLYFESQYLLHVPLLRIPVCASYSFTSNPSVCFTFLYFESHCVLHVQSSSRSLTPLPSVHPLSLPRPTSRPSPLSNSFIDDSIPLFWGRVGIFCVVMVLCCYVLSFLSFFLFHTCFVFLFVCMCVGGGGMYVFMYVCRNESLSVSSLCTSSLQSVCLHVILSVLHVCVEWLCCQSC